MTLSGPAPLKADEAPALIRRHGVSAFGDLKYPEGFAHFDYVNPNAPRGGRIRMRTSGGRLTFGSFNPFIFKGDPAEGSGLLFDSLMARASDETDAMYGLVAESVSLPPDRAFAIFHLRPEARFSDGSALTAADVVWSLETLKEKGAPQFKLPLRAVTGATALDAQTVRYDFAPEAGKRDLPLLVAQLPIFSKAYYADRDFEKVTLEPPLGSGAYLVKDYKPGRSVTYQRREDYWADDLNVMQGVYNFGEVTYEYYVDSQIGLEAFKSGAFDLTEEFRSASWATQYDFPAIQKGWVKKEQIPDRRPSGTQGWWINTRKKKFADPRVRKAIDYAYDFEDGNRRLFYGIYDRTDSFFENSTMQAEGPPSAGELALLEPLRDQIPEEIRDEVFGYAYTPPVNDGSGDARPSLLAARALLAEAGWTIQDGELRNAEGEDFEIEFLLYAGGGFQRITIPFAANLELLGFKPRLRNIDPAAMEFRLKQFDFDLTVRRYSMRLTPGPELRAFLSSESANEPGSLNLSGVDSPVVDALVEKVVSAETREAHLAALRALDRVFRAGHYWVSNWYKGSYAVAYWDRFGRPRDLGIEEPLYDRGVLGTWWYDEAKSAALDVARGHQ